MCKHHIRRQVIRIARANAFLVECGVENQTDVTHVVTAPIAGV